MSSSGGTLETSTASSNIFINATSKDFILRTSAISNKIILGNTPDAKDNAAIYINKNSVGIRQLPSLTSILEMPGFVVDNSCNVSMSNTLYVNNISVKGTIIPSIDVESDLGSSNYRFRDLYLSSNNIHLGGTVISRTSGGDIKVFDESTGNLKNIVTNGVSVGSVNISESNGDILLGNISTALLSKIIYQPTDNYTGFGIQTPLTSLHVDNSNIKVPMRLMFTHKAHVSSNTVVTNQSGFQFLIDYDGNGAVQNYLSGANVSLIAKDAGKIFIGSNDSTGSINIYGSNNSTVNIKTYSPNYAAALTLDATIGTFNSATTNVGGRNFYIRSTAGSASNTTANDRAGVLEIGDSGGNARDNAARNNLVVLDRFSRLWLGRDIIPAKIGAPYVGTNSNTDSQPAVIIVGDSNIGTLKLPLIHLGRNAKNNDTTGFGAQLVDNAGTNTLRIGRGDIKNNLGNPAYNNDFTINSAGNIGIGTTPLTNAKLYISNPGAKKLQFDNDTATNRHIVLWQTGDNEHQFYGIGINNNTFRSQIDSSSAFYTWNAGASTTTSTEIMRLTGTGNLGIGSATPTEKLHVIGNIKATGTLTATNTTIANISASNLSLPVLGVITTQNIVATSNVINIGCDANTDTINIACSTTAQTVNIGTTGSSNSVINIGGPQDTVNILGTTNNVATTNTTACNKTIDMNFGGASGTGGGVGINIIEAGNAAGYIKTSIDRMSWLFKAPGSPETKIDLTSGNIGLGSLIINTNSNIGIGTAVPAYKLDVNGTINAVTYCNIQWSFIQGVPTLGNFVNDLSNFTLNTTFTSNLAANTISTNNLTIATSATIPTATITSLTTSNIAVSNLTVNSLFTSNISTPSFGAIMTMGCDTNTTRIDIGAGYTSLLNIGTNNSGTVINIGGITDTINIPGTLIATVADTLPQSDGTYTYTDIDLGSPEVKNTDPEKLVATALVIGSGISPLGPTSVINDKFRIGQYVDAKRTLTLNRDSAPSSASYVGIEIEENGVINGWMETTGDRSGFWFKSPAATQIYTIAMGANYVSFNNNTMIMVGDSNGYIGMGTNNPNPAYKLHVAGALYANSYVNLPTADAIGNSGITSLSTLVNSTSTTVAATPSAVKFVYDTAIGISNITATKWAAVSANITAQGIVYLSDATNSNNSASVLPIAASTKAVYDTYAFAATKWTPANATEAAKGYVYITDSTNCNIASATSPIAASTRAVYNVNQTALAKWTAVNATATTQGYVFLSDATNCNRSWSNNDVLYPGPIAASTKAVYDVMDKTIATSNIAFSNLRSTGTTYGHVYLTDSTACNNLTANNATASFAATPAAVNSVFTFATNTSNLAGSKWTQVSANATQQGTVYLLDAVNSNLLATNVIPFAASPAAISTVNTIAINTSNQAFACWKPVNATTSVKGYVSITDVTTCNVTAASGLAVVPSAAALSSVWSVAVTASNQAYTAQPIGTSTVSGLLKLSDSVTDATNGIGNGIAATPKAIQQAYALAGTKFTDQPAQSAQRGTVYLTDSTNCNVSQSTQALAASALAVYNAYQMGVTASNLAMTRPQNLGVGTTTASGAVQLSDDPTSTSTTLAATINAVSQVRNIAVASLPKTGGTLTGDLLGIDGKFTGSIWSGHGGNFVQLWKDYAIIAKSTAGLRFGLAADTAATGFSEKMRIHANGNIGIGTTAPATLLDILGGSVKVKSDLGATTTSMLTLDNTNRSFNFYPYLTNTSYNPLVSTGDHGIIFTDGTTGTGSLVIAPWNGASKGIKVNNVGVGINGAPHSSYALRVAGDAIVDGGFIRTVGSTGWYNETYAGGWYMTDNIWVRSFADKPVYTGGNICCGGNIGIGRTDPTQKLHVSGGTVLIDGGWLNFPTNNSTGVSWGAGYSKIYDDANLHIFTDDLTYFDNNNGNAMTIAANKYIGIGNSAPAAKLHITGTGAPFTGLLIHNTGTGGNPTNSGACIDFRGYDAASSYTARIRSGDGIGGSYGGTMMFYTKTSTGTDVDTLTEAMRITETQNVGIGTTTPSTKLHVGGSILATQIHLGNYEQASASNGNSPVYGIGLSNSQVCISGWNGIRFFTNTNAANHNERMVIDISGNVGIGTKTPSSKLDVHGTSTTAVISVGTDDAQYGRLVFGNANHGIARGASISTATNLNDIAVHTAGDGSIVLCPGLTEAMRANNVGNIGMGTPTPSVKLHVVGQTQHDISTSAGVTIRNTLAAISPAELVFDKTAATAGGASQKASIGMDNNTRNFFILVNGSDRVNIDTAGNVGIGSVAPAYKLDVNGGIGISSINVLEFGRNVSGKEGNAGKIGYQTFTTNLDIIGAGTPGNSRGVRIFDRLGIGMDPAYNLDVSGVARTGSIITSAVSTTTLQIGGVPELNFTESFGVRYTGTYIQPFKVKATLCVGYDINNFDHGTNNLYVAGNTGLGTVVPITRLHTYVTGSANYLTIQGDVAQQQGIVFSDTTSRWIMYKPASTTDFRFYDGASDRITFQNGGNVGIGTTNPLYKLDVVGDINLTGTIKVNGTVFSPGGSSPGWTISAAGLYTNCNIGMGVVPVSKLDVNGDIHTSTQLLLNSSQGIRWGTDTSRIYESTSILFVGSSNAVAIKTGGNERMRIDNTTGYVGIGTTTPTRTLSISSGQAAGGMFGLKQTTTGGECSMSFDNTTGTMAIGLGGWGMAAAVFSLGGVLNISGTSVGLGTSTPSQQFHNTGNAINNNSFVGDVGHGASYAGFAHSSSATQTAYAILSDNIGNTMVNCQSGRSITFREGNGENLNITGGKLSCVKGIAVTSGDPGALIEKYYGGGNDRYGVSHDPGGVTRVYCSSSYGPATVRLALAYSATSFYDGLTLNTSGNIGISNNAPGYRLDVSGDIACNFIRTRGGCGWYSETYGGGWYMSDTTWIRAHGNKNVWTEGSICCQGNMGVGTSGPGFKLDVNGTANFKFRTGAWIVSEDDKWRFNFGWDGRTYYGSRNGYEFRSNGDGNIGELTNSGCLNLPGGDSKQKNYGWLNSGGGTGKASNVTSVYSIETTYRIACSEINAVSDRRAKKDITSFADEICIKLLSNLEQKHFRMKSDDSVKIGFIAQEVEEVVPNAVSHIDRDGFTDFRVLDHNQLVGVLWGAVRHLNTTVNSQQDRITSLENDVASLKLLVQQLIDAKL
jgi:hypothetical protein